MKIFKTTLAMLDSAPGNNSQEAIYTGGNSMKFLKRLLVAVGVLLISSSVLAGQGFKVKFNQVKGMKPILDYSLDDYSIKNVQLDGQNFSQITFEGSVKTEQKGFAELPYIHATVQLQPTQDTKVQVVYSDYVDHKLSQPLVPSKGVIYRNQDPSKIAYEIAPASIKDEWYPSNLATNSKPFIFRDVRGTNVYVYPFRYNAKKNILRVYRNVALELIETKSSTNALRNIRRQINPTMDKIYESMFVNYLPNSRGINVGELGDILVIYTGRDAEAIQPYIQWKKEKGFAVYEKQVAKGANVKDLIKNEYEQNPNILYVQLVGDWEDIKSDLGPDRAPTDPMLGCVEGTDYFADVIVGRFSAKSAKDVAVQVEKTINYERNPDVNGNWYKNAIGIASAEGGSSNGDDGESDQMHLERIRDYKLLPTTYSLVHEDYDTNSINAATVGKHINAGAGFINYVGHGSSTSWVTSSFSNTDIGKLKNKNMLPFIVSVACVNGEFHKSRDSFAEAWLKKENGGAVATWMATINQPWAPPMRGQDYFSDLLIGGYNYSSNPGSGITINTQRTTFGSLTVNAANLMYKESNTGSDRETVQTWTVFGDASLQVRTDTPIELSLSNEIVLMGVPFETTVTSNGTPIEGAIVTLYQDGRSFTGVTDAYGIVEIEQDLAVADAKITVTGFNTATINKTIGVIPPTGAYLTVAGFTILDDNSAIDYGETVDIALALKNVGKDSTSNITTIISSESEYVTSIEQNNSGMAYLAAEATKTLDTPFTVTFAENVPDQTVIPFDVHISGIDGTYQAKFFVTVNAPVLDVAVNISNGTTQPGDLKQFFYTIKNVGHSKAIDLTAELAEITGIELDLELQGNQPFDIEAGEEINLTAVILFSDNIVTGTNAKFELKVADKTFSHALTIGMTESFETGSLDNISWLMLGDASWTVDTETVYAGSYAGKSGTIDHRKTSEMSIEMHYPTAGTIKFFRKVSSELRYDFLKFYIDNQLQSSWSGEQDWEEVTFNVPAGNHTFSWVYSKDGSLSKGKDCAWVDNILAAGGTPL